MEIVTLVDIERHDSTGDADMRSWQHAGPIVIGCEKQDHAEDTGCQHETRAGGALVPSSLRTSLSSPLQEFAWKTGHCVAKIPNSHFCPWLFLAPA
jgi:hypothetical protein